MRMRKRLAVVMAIMLAFMALVLNGCMPSDANNLGNMYFNDIAPNTANTYNNGSSTFPWATGYFQNINLNGTLITATVGALPALGSGELWVGNGSNAATALSLSGDISMTNSGATTVLGLKGKVLPALSTGYLYYNSGAGMWSFAAGGGGGISSVDTGTPSNITGILTGNGSTIGSITNNSALWNTALQSAGTTPGTYNNVTVGVSGLVTSGSSVSYVTGTPWTGMGYITGNQTITLGGILSGSGTTAITASAASGYYMPSTSDQTTWNAKQAGSSILSGLSSLSYTSGSPFVTMTGAGSFGLDSTAYESVSALGSWAGSANITTLGTVTTGTLSGITLQGTIASGTGLTFGNFSAGTITAALSGNATTATSAGSVTGLSVTAGKTLTVTNDATISGTPLSNPMTILGDIVYENAVPAPDKLSGNTTSTDEFLRSTGSGGLATAPSWQAVSKADVGLSSVENTALSTWAGSINITTLGTVTTGTLQSITLQGTISSGSGLTFGNFTAGTITGALSGNATTATSAGSVTGLSVTAAKTLTVSNSMTLTATDGSTLAIGTGGTLGTAAYTSSGAYSPLAGSSSIVTVGTVTTGTWNGGIIGGTYGGTGVNNSTRTITLSNGNITLAPPVAGATLTLGGNLTTSGAYASTFTMSNTTTVTFPTTGTLATLLGTESLAAKTIVQASNDFPKTTVLAANTAGVMTFTAAQLIGGLIVRTAMGAARSDVTDSAANIVAAIPNYVVGTSFEFKILNQTATYTETLTAGSGVTITGTATTATLCYHWYLAVITGASAVTIYSLGTATY